MSKIALAFAAGSFLSGLFSAWYWYNSSKTEFNVSSVTRAEASPTGFSQEDWDHFRDMLSLNKYVIVSGKLNKKAALWSAAAILLATLSQFLSAV